MAVAQELEIFQWFTARGTFYDNVSNSGSVAGSIIQPMYNATFRHMRCDLNPKPLAEFTNKDRCPIGAIQLHNIVHDSNACQNTINSLLLPMERLILVSCNTKEQKAMIIARDSNATGRNGKGLHKKQPRRFI